MPDKTKLLQFMKEDFCTKSSKELKTIDSITKIRLLFDKMQIYWIKSFEVQNNSQNLKRPKKQQV